MQNLKTKRRELKISKKKTKQTDVSVRSNSKTDNRTSKELELAKIRNSNQEKEDTD